VTGSEKRVSVVLPTFNRRKVLERALASAPSRIGPDDDERSFLRPRRVGPAQRR